MSNVSIFGKKWIDLVFEGKNKSYGAYQLRQESSRTTLLAFFAGLFFISSLSGLGLLLSSFGNKPDMDLPPNPNDSIIVVNVLPPVTEHQVRPLHPAGQENPNPNSQHFVPAPTPQADPSAPETNPAAPSDGNPNGGNDTEPTTGGGPVTTGNEGPLSAPPSNNPAPPATLDEQPEYPGGIKRFYQYVADNFDRPNVDDLDKISVLVSFVIEKDGSMTDIKVLRNPGYGLDKEAIRVLKSLRTKWKAGIKDGEKVRTQYTLPITIQMMN